MATIGRPSANLAAVRAAPSLSLMNEVARKAPYLTQDREMELATAWTRDRDPAALDVLVRSHARLVLKMASGYVSYGLSPADLVSEGNVGLLESLKRFDPGRGFRVSTYASWWIDAMLKSYVIANWSLVKLGTTADQKKLFFGLRRAKARLSAYGDGDLSDEDVATIAKDLDVDAAAVVAMNRRLGGDRSLNAPVVEDGGELQDALPDESDGQDVVLARDDEFAKRGAVLREALGGLQDRERDVIQRRRLSDDPATLEALASVYGVTRERIRQIEVKAMDKLARSVTKLARSRGLLGDGGLAGALR